jgi:transcriptional regulator with GAF, ATPase, and Fis domain
VAREIHRLSGRQREMLAINCSALAPQIIDSQLFGHVRGSFTGADADSLGLFRAAHGGTLFLDEIGELPLDLQPKLLRALQEGEIHPVGSNKPVRVDVRIIAATNRDLESLIEVGAFRRDLYARLALWELRVPPLRERRADLLDWISRLHAAWHEQRGGGAAAPPLVFHAEAADLLLRQDWPDNLRGLDRLVHELSIRDSAEGPVTRLELPAWVRAESPGAMGPPVPDPERSVPGTKPRRPAPARDEFIAAYDELEGNIHALARRFDRDRRQVYRWIDGFGLRPRSEDDGE